MENVNAAGEDNGIGNIAEGLAGLDLAPLPLIMGINLFFDLMKRTLPDIALKGKHFTYYLSLAYSLGESKSSPIDGTVHPFMHMPVLFQTITPPNIRHEQVPDDRRPFTINLDGSIRLNIDGIRSLINYRQPPHLEAYPGSHLTFGHQLTDDLSTLIGNPKLHREGDPRIIGWSYPLRNVSLVRRFNPLGGIPLPYLEITGVEENPAGAGAGAMEGGRRRKRTRTKRRKSKSKKSRRR